MDSDRPASNPDAELPLRAELFSIRQLEQHAKTLAGWHEVQTAGRFGAGKDQLLDRLDSNREVLAETYDLIANAVSRGRRITPAAEWFLDNYYLIEEQIRAAKRHLPKAYSRELPRLVNDPASGFPRVYSIALELISHADGRVDGESLRAFVNAYQLVKPLRLGELWAIPIMLRLALLENLRRVATRITSGRRDRERAAVWVERILDAAAKNPTKAVLALADMVKADPELTNAFVAEFASRLHGQGPSLIFPMTWLEQRLSEQGQSIEHVFQQASQNQAADQVSIGNSIGSLRFLGATDWRVFVESMSVVERTLATDPTGLYSGMDFATRDRYRHVIEDVAKRSRATEEEVAQKVVELARRAGEEAAQASVNGRKGIEGHIGYYLIGKGRHALERSVYTSFSLRRSVTRVAGRHVLVIYLVSIGVVTIMATGFGAWLAAVWGMRPLPLVVVLPFLLLIATQIGVSVVHWLAPFLTNAKILPRMDFSLGIPPECRTVVAVPTMLADVHEVDELLSAMEIRHLANADENLLFALLTDFKDSDQESTPEDALLLERARRGIEALNRLYGGHDISVDAADPAEADNAGENPNGHGPDDNPPQESARFGPGNGPFYLLHRRRQWNEQEGVWMGWERKRGKLEQFNQALRGDSTAFSTIVGDQSRLQGVKYVISLDSDTQLPRDSARKLVATMAHPLNHPRYDAKHERVVSGYTILQPRVGISMPSANRSAYSRAFAGEPGIDPYTQAVSDVYQDVFEEGSFIGKGIYDVDAFQKALGGRFPENRILSHDLLEGAHARSGLVTDVVLFEDYPYSYLADAGRRHRWIRGDWQIACWLFPKVPGHAGAPCANVISTLSKWKVLDNLRRSLMPVGLVLLLVLAWLTPGGTVVLTILAISTLLLPPTLSAVSDLLRRPADLPVGQHHQSTAKTFARQVVSNLFVLSCLPYEAHQGLDAIGRTGARLLHSRRKLLEWRTSSDALRSAHGNLAGFIRAMWISPVAAIVTLLATVALRPGAMVTALPIIMLWTASPFLAWRLSRPTVAKRPQLSSDDLMFLRGLARRTWRFFEVFVTADDHFLPPDNVQEDPPVGVAHRTSPTNIGLSLLAGLAAYDFGYISVGEVIGRTRRTLDTIGRLHGHRGHLFNWYDTRTLEPLRPLYISTVDSGNMVGHLLILASGLKELSDQPVFRSQVISGLEDTLHVVAEIARQATAGDKNVARISPDTFAKMARLRETLREHPPTLSGSRLLLKRLRNAAGELSLGLRGHDGFESWVHAFEDQCRFALEELVYLAPWLEAPAPDESLWSQANVEQAAVLGRLRALLQQLDQVPTLADAAKLQLILGAAITAVEDASSAWPAGVKEWLLRLRAAGESASERATHRLSELKDLNTRCTELADISYDFLYDPERHLLSIGYNVSDRRLDASYYDLLASEARLTSYVAVAQGKLPQEHWFSLGRLLTSAGGKAALLSWSGSMFEYLMPLVVMPTYDQTLLDDTYRAVVRRQIEYGRQRGVPWGVSESGYNEFDTGRNYQYHAFGIPGLGLKRGLAEDLVIAPYASAMALMVDPESSCANLQELEKDGQVGLFGLYEAIDYTPSRVPRGQKSVTIRSYMVHHQGMAFLSMAYLLLNRPMQRRFAADPAFRAIELLLQERVPKVPMLYPHSAEVSAVRAATTAPQAHYRVFNTPNTLVPEVHLLSNGRYHVAVTASGGGYSRWRDLALTRWHEDVTCDAWGTFCYIRDVETGAFWSSAHQPTLRRATKYEAVYSQGRAEFRRRDSGLDTHVEISVSPEDDVELRRISLTNRGTTTRTIELTSYAEVVLATAAADAAHPAFSNLFVQTELVRDLQAILCTRRPRSASEHPPYMFHLMTVHGRSVRKTSYETARNDFIGRGRSVADPRAMHVPALGDTEGAVLDPIVAIRNTISLAPNETARIHLVTGATETRDQAVELVEKYHDRRLADRVFELAWTHSQVVLRQLDATEADIQLYGRLASNILYAHPLLRAPGSVIARNRRGQSGLWGYGISGDLPIVLLRMSDQSHIDLVRQMVRAHSYWRGKGLVVDLVIWNEDQSGYRQSLHDQIMGTISSLAEANLVDKYGGIFVRRLDQMSEEDKVLLQTVARVVISDTAGTLMEQMDRRARAETPIPAFAKLPTRKMPVPVAVEISRPDLAAFNGMGGFTHDGREYVITTTAETSTPAPWVNVLANPWFGTVVSESGGAYTWCENAHEYRLTPWHNDPVSDLSGEAVYLRDEESGRFWSPTPLPARGAMPYTTRHGFGYTIFEYTEDGISTEMRTYVATDAPIKFLVIKVRNDCGKARRLSLTSYFGLVLGPQTPGHRPYVVTEIDPKTGAMLARNSYNTDFADRVAFLDASEAQRTVTGNRTEFIGRNGGLNQPACMFKARLSGQTGAGLDPCLAMQVMLELADGEEREVVFTFGSGKDLADARNLVMRFRGTGPARTALEAVWGYWNRTLGAVHVQTPDAALNYLANGWLLYQVLACRIWARSGFYQSGGAFGFRDQLQDAMALVHTEPALLRQQLLRSAEHQFREGDVQHWWHPPIGRGVRTRISDDYLWLPLATCRYVNTTGDTGVLDETVRFIDGRLVQPTEESYYDLPARSEESASLYEHCLRAIRNGLRFGERGLPFMGCGDWNDGMNLVGEHGRGESVWLGMFLYDVLMQFASVAERRGDKTVVELCKSQAAQLRENIEKNAWDGQWYRRAYFDSGEPLGSSSSPECKIDSLPQSWAVLSGAVDAERARQAMQAVDAHLADRSAGVIRLFDPAFDKSQLNPGYIKGYVPGVRENGGQYTHAAVWVVMAFAQSRNSERAWELFNLINPVRHGDTEAAIARYKVEPYVIAADVYTNPQHVGRGGWTWYTGSAGWMYRLIIESLLGLKLEIDRLHVRPLLPAGWDAFDMHYRFRDTFYHIHVRRGTGGVVCDGVAQADGSIPLIDDRQEHRVEVQVAE